MHWVFLENISLDVSLMFIIVLLIIMRIKKKNLDVKLNIDFVNIETFVTKNFVTRIRVFVLFSNNLKF